MDDNKHRYTIETVRHEASYCETAWHHLWGLLKLFPNKTGTLLISVLKFIMLWIWGFLINGMEKMDQ
jgi:hypothetical protein